MLRMSGGGVMTPMAAVCEATEAGLTTGSPEERTWSAPSGAGCAVVASCIAFTGPSQSTTPPQVNAPQVNGEASARHRTAETCVTHSVGT